ncbi:hypothetical protein ACFL0W_06805, partial [Nanoarchaeota archaeon]
QCDSDLELRRNLKYLKVEDHERASLVRDYNAVTKDGKRKYTVNELAQKYSRAENTIYRHLHLAEQTDGLRIDWRNPSKTENQITALPRPTDRPYNITPGSSAGSADVALSAIARSPEKD